MQTRRLRRCHFLSAACGLLLGIGLLPGPAHAFPLFDAHIHYTEADAEHFTPQQVLAILDRNDITQAVVSGTPTTATEALYRAAPERIVPFLGLYRSDADKPDWFTDEALPGRVEAALHSGIYRGIGEFHIFAEHRHSPVLRRVVEIAAARSLVLQVHGDPAIIDAIFAYAPAITLIWAHAGTHPSPTLLAGYLERYPNLYVDTSVRDERIAPAGALSPEWRALFLAHSERFLVGVDTFSTNRWRHFDEVVAQIRAWLKQLPPEVATKLAHGNAARIFGQEPERSDLQN